MTQAVKFNIDGCDTTVEGLKEHRAQMIILRDGALQQNQFDWSVLLSHNVAILAALIAHQEEAARQNPS